MEYRKKVLPMARPFLSYRGKAEIAEQAVVDALREAVGVIAQLLGVGCVAQIGQLNQDCLLYTSRCV